MPSFGIQNPGLPDAEDQVECESCGSHFVLSPGAGATDGLACPECGGLRLFRSQPSPTQSDGTLRNMVDSDSQKDMGGNPLGEGTIVGDGDGHGSEKPFAKRDNFMHGGVSVTQRVGMRPLNLNMETYPFLWELPKVALVEDLAPVAEQVAPLVGDAASAAGSAIGDLASGAWGAISSPFKNFFASGAKGMAKTVMKGVAQTGSGYAGGQAGAASGGSVAPGAQQVPGAQAGGMAPTGVTPAPSMFSLGSVDIPRLLLADYDTPHSVPSLDEQNDDPEKQDQKEFNSGDRSPSNFENPNLQDSGANGEDNARSDAGFREGSPGIERMEMMMPLLLHYYQSEESGMNDPMVKALHEALEQESPGYLDGPDEPGGHEVIQRLIQHHQQPQGVHAALNQLPMPGQLQAPQIMGAGAGGSCAQCGGVLTADGSCPQCGYQAQDTGMKVPPTTGLSGGLPGGAPRPPMTGATLANHPGPVTPEQISAVQQYLVDHDRADETPNVPLHPDWYTKEMSEIAQDPNVAPQPDPSEVTPLQPMPTAPGSMPMPGMGAPGGGGQPMQPMAALGKTKEADANNAVPRCPECNSATTSVLGLGDNTTDGTGDYSGYCHACGKTFSISKKSRVVFADLTEIPNPGQHHDDQMVWKDNSDHELIEGQTYELHAPSSMVPDRVKVIYVHPDEVGLQLIDGISQAAGGDEPDFKVNRQEAQLEHYTFVPTREGEGIDNRGELPPGTPGLEQVPPSGQTTDQHQDSYPNTSVSHVEDDPPCTKCGASMVDHTMSAADTIMHECVKCAHVWETHDQFEGREAGVDLAWLMHDDDHDFHEDMERYRAMAASGKGQSRSLSSIVSDDERYQQIKSALDTAHEQRVAGKHFTPGEKRDLIDEYGVARNLDDLDLSNTHYDIRWDHSGAPLGREADESRVPDSHLILGV